VLFAVVVVGLGGLRSGLIVFDLGAQAEGHGTDAAIAAIHQREGRIRARGFHPSLRHQWRRWLRWSRRSSRADLRRIRRAPRPMAEMAETLYLHDLEVRSNYSGSDCLLHCRQHMLDGVPVGCMALVIPGALHMG
jgi:hypothetical protein